MVAIPATGTKNTLHPMQRIEQPVRRYQNPNERIKDDTDYWINLKRLGARWDFCGRYRFRAGAIGDVREQTYVVLQRIVTALPRTRRCCDEYPTLLAR